jgi:hypothetical protein
LTEWGLDLEPVVLALGRWGSRAPFPDADARLGPDALMIALKTVFDPSTAPQDSIVIELRLGDDHFRATVADRRLDIVRGGAAGPDAMIACDPGALAGVLWHGGSLEHPQIKLEGHLDAIERFLALFGTPRPASAAASR